jgi:hypothetical protein
MRGRGVGAGGGHGGGRATGQQPESEPDAPFSPTYHVLDSVSRDAAMPLNDANNFLIAIAPP